MKRFRNRPLIGFLVPLLIVLVAGCASQQPVKQSWVENYKYIDFDPFPGMDVQGRDVTLSRNDIYGRVIWNIWSGDNAGFWNWLAQYGFGTTDLLKMIADVLPSDKWLTRQNRQPRAHVANPLPMRPTSSSPR